MNRMGINTSLWRLNKHFMRKFNNDFVIESRSFVGGSFCVAFVISYRVITTLARKLLTWAIVAAVALYEITNRYLQVTCEQK